MLVSYELPASVYVRIEQIAQARGENVETFLQQIAYRITRASDHDDLVILWSMGWSDKEIADELGIPRSNIADRRRDRGLPANRKGHRD